MRPIPQTWFSATTATRQTTQIAVMTAFIEGDDD